MSLLNFHCAGLYFPVFGLNAGKYGSEKILYLDTFQTVLDQSVKI